MQPLKVLAVLAGSFFGSLLAAAILLFITAAATSGSGAGRTGNALLMMLALDAVLFILATLGVFLGLRKFVEPTPIRVLLTAGFGVALAIAGVLIAVSSAVFLNR